MFYKIIKYIFVFFLSISNTFAIFGFDKVDDGLKLDRSENIDVGIMNILEYLLTFLYLVTFIWVTWSGFQILTAAGDDEKVKTGKKRIIFALVGIIIISLSYWIVDAVLKGINI